MENRLEVPPNINIELPYDPPIPLLIIYPDNTLIQQNKEETVNHDIFHSSISSQGQHPFIEAISSYASFSCSQNPSSFHKIFEDSLDEDLLESSTKQTSIKHIVLKYALDDNDLYSESSHTNNRKILSVKEKVIMNALINFHQKNKLFFHLIYL